MGDSRGDGHSDDENVDVEVDVLGNNKRYKQRHRRDLRLNYDSDSSDEDYENEKENAEKANGEKEDVLDEDMFASDNEEKDEPCKDVKDPKKPEFLDIDEFERQEGIGQFDEEVPLATDENSDSEEPEEDDPEVVEYYNNIEDYNEQNSGRLKRKEPKIEAFNLREEALEGQFDLDGNYIRQEEDNHTDAEQEWLNDYKRSDVLNARKAQEQREKAREKKLVESAQELISTDKLLTDLVECLEAAETPMEALARLAPKKKNKNKVDETEKQRKKLVVRITELCDKLINEKNITDTYDMSREEFMRLYKQETGQDYKISGRGTKRTREDEPENEAQTEASAENEEEYGEKIWLFQWIDDSNVHGPFSAYEMSHWKETYFNNQVVVRKLDEEEFVPVETVEFNETT